METRLDVRLDYPGIYILRPSAPVYQLYMDRNGAWTLQEIEIRNGSACWIRSILRVNNGDPFVIQRRERMKKTTKRKPRRKAGHPLSEEMLNRKDSEVLITEDGSVRIYTNESAKNAYTKPFSSR